MEQIKNAFLNLVGKLAGRVTPNQLTLFRMAMTPVIAVLICSGAVWTAFLLYIVTAATDWLDGYLARLTGQTTLAGKIFDANTDKLLVIGCLVSLAYTDSLKMGLEIPAIAIVFREILVSGLREFAALRDASKPGREYGIVSSQMARVKTGVQMVAVGLLIPTSALHSWHPYYGFFSGAWLWAAGVLSVLTGWHYWQAVKPELK